MHYVVFEATLSKFHFILSSVIDKGTISAAIRFSCTVTYTVDRWYYVNNSFKYLVKQDAVSR